MKKHLLIISCLFFFLSNSKAQELNEIIIYYKQLKQKKIKYKNETNLTFFEAKKEASDEWEKLISQGYLNASIDSITIESNHFKIHINERKKVEIKSSKKEEGNKTEIETNPFKKNNIVDYPIQLNKVLVELNNCGFPFANLDISSSSLDSNNLNFNIKLEKGPQVRIDSLINPELNEKQLKLLKRLIEIDKGTLFNYEKIIDIESTISNLSYLKSIRPPAYEFIDGKAIIYTYIKMKSSNNANGIIGIQPDNEGRIQFTGNIMLDLNNNFNYGEKIEFKWRKMFNASQNLISSVNLPYVFGAPLEFDANINMIRKDTSFFNFDASANFCYSRSPKSKIGIVFTQNLSTNVQQSNYNFTSTKNFGFIIEQNHLNRNINPTKGWRINSSIKTGNKQTLFSTSDDLVETPNYNLILDYCHFIKLTKRLTSKQQISLNSTVNENLFENELDRIGGYNSIRGFDEESIWASSYGVSNTEIHFAIDNESSIFLFSDWAWTERKLTTEYENIWLKSFGFGTNIGFNNGLLSLVYGLGSVVGEPTLLRTGKIHIGFTSFF